MSKSYQNIDTFNDLEGTDTTNCESDKNLGLSMTSKLFALTCLLILALVGVYMSSDFGNPEASPFELSHKMKSKSSDQDSLSVVINASSPDYPALESLMYLPWQYIIEPYRDQILELSSLTINGEDKSSDLDDTSSAYVITWDLNGDSYVGSSVTVHVKTTGVLNATVSIYDSSSDQTYTQPFSVAVKYVRREIRSMTDDDRDTFIRTLRLLYDIDVTSGQAKYGDKYASAENFLSKHLNGAGRTDCDHWHDGAGITTHHVAFTLEAEQALQSIEPSIAMPYWEYAMDAYMYDTWSESLVFADEWFGQATPDTADHSLDTGVFANIKVPDGSRYLDWDIASTGSLNPYVNAYGDMRSPWNNNPSQIIGRLNTTYGARQQVTRMPDCVLMSACYSSSSYANMADCLNGVTHGPVHILIGGTWGQGDTFTGDNFKNVSFLEGIDKLLFFKMLWRSGFTRCPVQCDTATKVNQTCACAVPDEYIEEYGAKYMLEVSGIWDIVTGLNQVAEDASDSLLLQILRAIEDSGIAGDMFSSGAPFDPSFWPVHGQIERILSLKRIRLSQGTISSKQFDETWAYATENKEYLVGICDWSGVSSATDLTLPSCNMSADAICEGHHETDVLEFSNFLGTGDTYTNAEFYDFIHPWNEELPYIYDTYGFDYCIDEGFLNFES